MTRPVFSGTETIPPLAEAKPGLTLELSGSEARHLQVQRLQPGEELELVDQAGLRVLAEVIDEGTADRTETTSSRGRQNMKVVSLRVKAVETTQLPTPRFTLVQALSKNGRDEQAVEAAVELGVSRVIPWAAERSIVQWKAKKLSAGQQKWRDLVEKAAKQSRRAHWPEVTSLYNSKDLGRLIAETPAEVTVLILESTGTKNLVEWVQGTTGREHSEIWVLVGPEGGISDNEIAQFTAAGAELVRLGGTILRASNAGPTALAVLTALTGFWASGSRG